MRIGRSSKLSSTITFWTYATFLGIFIPTSALVVKNRRLTALRDVTLLAALSGYTATVVNSTLWRTQEARMLESSEVISRLVPHSPPRPRNTTSPSLTSPSPKKKPMYKNYSNSTTCTAKMCTLRDEQQYKMKNSTYEDDHGHSESQTSVSLPRMRAEQLWHEPSTE
jgi:hypothetical protein